jgi:hypothetical protein
MLAVAFGMIVRRALMGDAHPIQSFDMAHPL